MAGTPIRLRCNLPENALRVYLVAGNRLLREALTRVLNKRGIHVAGVSACAPDTVSSIASSGANILVLDSVIDRPSVWAFLSEVVTLVPRISVVLIDMREETELFLQSVQAGAVGYILRDASASEVVSGILAVARGEAVCPPQLCIHLFRAVSRQWTAAPSARMKIDLGLTKRQQELIPLISRGLTNKEIASRLHLSEQTVKNHIHRMMRRMGANDRLQVIDQTRHWISLQ
jgi:DNA-binding NarL/FixJ family response regulator